ncbi:hypothetical protein DO70_5191 [Burkholderia pseudomallei]|nr:hypothetical protein DO70_5191 [Burkholderia pseudomallei]
MPPAFCHHGNAATSTFRLPISESVRPKPRPAPDFTEFNDGKAQHAALSSIIATMKQRVAAAIRWLRRAMRSECMGGPRWGNDHGADCTQKIIAKQSFLIVKI